MSRSYIINEYIVNDSCCILKIYGGKFGEVEFLIDVDDVEKCKDKKWYIGKFKKHKGLKKEYCYAYTNDGLLLHRYVMNCTDRFMVVDHISGDTQDNKKSNLQICTGTQNLMKQGFSDANKSGHKGVMWCNHLKTPKWTAYITKNRKRKHLGYFDNYEDAVKARLSAESIYFEEEFMPIKHTYNE